MKKKIIAIIVALTVVVGIVLFGQIFNVDSVSVQFENSSELTADEIISAGGIEVGSNIFILSKSEIKNNIESAYKDHSVAVTKIERFFPDNVTITVKKRMPLFLLPVANSTSVLPTDLDFHLNTAVSPDTVDLSKFVVINGVAVDATLDTEPLKLVRRVTAAFLANGFNEDSFKSMFGEITVDAVSSKITLHTKNFDNTVFVLDTSAGSDDDSVLLGVEALLDKFYSLSETERTNTVVSN